MSKSSRDRRVIITITSTLLYQKWHQGKEKRDEISPLAAGSGNVWNVVKVTQAKESREADLSGEVGELLYQR
jgi:hypothetical protein